MKQIILKKIQKNKMIQNNYLKKTLFKINKKNFYLKKIRIYNKMIKVNKYQKKIHYQKKVKMSYLIKI